MAMTWKGVSLWGHLRLVAGTNARYWLVRLVSNEAYKVR
jgi:hypothetical protein